MKSHFYLRYPKSTEPTDIHFHLFFGKKRLVFPTGYKVEPSKWDFDKQRPITNKALEEKLGNIKSNADVLLTELSAKRGGEKVITKDEMRTALKARLEGKEQGRVNLLAFITSEIEKRKNDYERKTIHSYIDLQRYIERFSKVKRNSLDFNDIDSAFFAAFRDYLQLPKCERMKGEGFDDDKTVLTDAYVKKLLSILKTFIRAAYFDHKEINENPKSFAVDLRRLLPNQGFRSDQQSLSFEEIQSLIELPLESEWEAKSRDLLVVACLTGLRRSDWDKLNLKENVIHTVDGYQFAEIVNQKTGEPCYIPLMQETIDILNKYDGALPYLSETTLKWRLKQVCEMAGIDERSNKREKRGGKVSVLVMPKFEFISTHTGRRSFVSNAKEVGMPKDLITLITGHKTGDIVDRYDRRSAQRKMRSLIPYLEKIEKLLRGDTAKEIAI